MVKVLQPFVFSFVFVVFNNANATEYVQSTPVDVFSDRSGVWNSDRIDVKGIQSDVDNPYLSLRSVPGIQSRFNGSPTISIRGSHSLPRVLGLLNGLPLNHSSGFGPNRLLIPHEALGEIRVFKGPASLFFGGDAMGGAVHFLSKRYASPVLRGQVGSFGNRGIFGAMPFQTSSESYNHLTSFSEHDDGNYPYTLSSSGQSGERRSTNRSLHRHTYFGHQKVGRWAFSENLIWAEEVAASPGSVRSPDVGQSQSSAGLASFTTNYKSSDKTEVSHRVFGTKSDLKFTDQYGTSDTSSSSMGNSLNLAHSFEHNLNSNVFIDHTYSDFRNTFSENHLYTANDVEMGTTLDIGLSDQLIIKPGTRYLFSYNRWVSGVGLFEESDRLKRWLTYSEGFRAPSLIQRFATTSNLLANSELKPESSSQVEFGFHQTLFPDPDRNWNKLTLGLSVFSLRYSEFITSQTVNSQSQPINRGSATAYGAEAKSEYAYEIWRFRASYNHLKTEDLNRKALPLSPENQYSAGIGFFFSILYFDFKHTIWDEMYDLQSGQLVPLNSWHSTDFSVETVNLNQWSVKLSALNLLDQPIELTYGYPEMQRRFYLTVERTF